jgi:hypothetical protein
LRHFTVFLLILEEMAEVRHGEEVPPLEELKKLYRVKLAVFEDA